MGGLCGWFGGEHDPETSRKSIIRMLRAVGGSSPDRPNYTCDNTRGLAVYPGIYETSLGELDGAKAALVGSPNWLDSKLADVAANHSPAQALIEGYRRYGKDMLAKLRGPFALAVVEGNNGLIAIDRIGIHTLSYAVQDGLIAFATSTGSVISHPKVLTDIDPQAIFSYFYFHDIPSPGTIYLGVEKLLPAQYVEFFDGQPQKGFYWKLHYKDLGQASFIDEKNTFFKLIRGAVEASARGDGPTATFLSGGTDSSTVTGLLSETMSKPVDTYSIGFGADGFDEMEYARLAARHFGANPHEYYLKPEDILEAIPLIAKSYPEPFGNESAVPTYFCAKRAAEDGIKVMLAGDGGDEIFGGNARYAKQMLFEHFFRFPGSVRRHFIEPLAFRFPGGDTFLPVRKLRSYIRQAKIPLPERMESYNFVYRQPLEEIFQTNFLSSVDPDISAEMLRDAYFRADSIHPINRMLHLDLKFTLADNDLRKVSRMCEVAGVEVRYPILDEAVVEFSANLPPKFKVKGQKLRWFFKESLKDFLPKEIIHKSKHGFGLPFGVWALSHPALKEMVEQSLDRFEDRGYMHPDYLQNLRKLHAEEHPTYFGKMIWLILILEQWLEAHGH